jgi:hypothetical protein
MGGSWSPLLSGPALAGGSSSYLTGEDALRLTVLNSVAGLVVTLSGRFLPLPAPGDTAPPHVQAFALPMVPTSNRVATTLTQKFGEGWLLDFSVRVSTGTPLKGQTYAIVTVGRGDSTAFVELSELACGYVTAQERLGMIDVGQSSATDGGGAPRAIVGTTPAAGADIVETVPTGARWQLQAFEATYVTSVAVANRQPSLVIDDGANVYAEFDGSAVTPASTTMRYSARVGMQNNETHISSNLQNWGLSPFVLPAGHRIRTATAGIQAADQWGSPKYSVIEWLEV